MDGAFCGTQDLSTAGRMTSSFRHEFISELLLYIENALLLVTLFAKLEPRSELQFDGDSLLAVIRNVPGDFSYDRAEICPLFCIN